MYALQPRVLVVIPARNEVDRITACLQAFAHQVYGDGQSLPKGTFGVILYVNNSDDATASLARSMATSLPYDLDVLEVCLQSSDASAGGARRLGMAEAAKRLEGHPEGAGILITTDADSRVPPRWIADILAILAGGVDAVAGDLVLDADDERRLPESLKQRGALEAAYDELLCRLECLIDPKAYDPWPRHAQEAGACLALTLASFQAVGGVPQRAVGEDRALCDALRMRGFRIRHASEASVITSGRLTGRAKGGCADTLRQRIADPSAPCDARLEPVVTAIYRYARRRWGFQVATPKRPGIHPGSLPLQIVLARFILPPIQWMSSFVYRMSDVSEGKAQIYLKPPGDVRFKVSGE